MNRSIGIATFCLTGGIVAPPLLYNGETLLMTERISDEGADYYKDRSTWMRGLFMLLFAALFHVTAAVTGAVAVVQFLWKLITGDTNPRLLRFGEDLARYFYQIMQFLTFNTEEKPFPFADWPSAPPAPRS